MKGKEEFIIKCMSVKTLLSLCLQVWICSLSAQDLIGKWYETENPRASLEINIERNNNEYNGTFTWKWKDRLSTLNSPIDKVEVKGDSLLFQLTHANSKVYFNLEKDNQTDTYKGFYYYMSRQLGAVTLSRKAIERDMSISPAPEKEYTRQDTLRGMVTPEREWWNLTYYDLYFALDIEKKYLKGSNTISYEVLEPKNVMQIDLQPPMKITKIQQSGESLNFTQDGNAYFIMLNEEQSTGSSKEIKLFYEGVPRENPMPPWGGGFTYDKDVNGKPFIYNASQGHGSSLWWPCKDHMYDEPDKGMKISVNVPSDLMAVANGKLLATKNKGNGTTTYEWTVTNAINNYGVSLNVADYVHFSDPYEGKKGKLECNYYVLPENLEKAKVHFKQAHLMLEAFEHWFGPYPFYEDSYKLVDGIGMEHQSSVGYSGKYINGMEGKDHSDSGWGLKFDYLIIHESSHEWFANSITFRDMADMWVHEGFGTYAEALYVEYHFGKKAGEEYMKGISHNISNRIPIIGDYDVNDKDYPGDVYVKGASVLHTLRQVINDDEKWRSILTGLNTEFYHQTVNTADIENYIERESGMNLKPFWNQYLRTTKIPTLEYYFKGNKFAYRWINTVPGFDMPLKVTINNEEQWIYPTTNWINEYTKDAKSELTINSNFYVAGFRNMN